MIFNTSFSTIISQNEYNKYYNSENTLYERFVNPLEGRITSKDFIYTLGERSEKLYIRHLDTDLSNYPILIKATYNYTEIVYDKSMMDFTEDHISNIMDNLSTSKIHSGFISSISTDIYQNNMDRHSILLGSLPEIIHDCSEPILNFILFRYDTIRLNMYNKIYSYEPFNGEGIGVFSEGSAINFYDVSFKLKDCNDIPSIPYFLVSSLKLNNYG